MAGVASSAREYVHFLGHVPSADLPRWYATGDIFCSPATGNESFGIVLVEAMAAGRAVVCSDIPGYRKDRAHSRASGFAGYHQQRWDYRESSCRQRAANAVPVGHRRSTAMAL